VRARASDDNVWVNYQLGDLEQGLSEYIVAAGLQSGQALFQSLNSLGTAVTGRALKPVQRLGCDSETGQKRRVFSPPVGCHTWRATGITILPGERRTA
jgi:hypothetical protein